MPAETAKATRPRARKATAPADAPAKKAAAKVMDGSPGTAIEKATANDAGEVGKLRLTLEQAPDTKNFAKFIAPDGSGCVGSLYVPLGAKSVKVLVEM